jgi:hypothetical protein
MDTYLKIRKYNIHRQNITALWSSVACLNSAIALKIFLDELQVYDMNFETAKYEHSYPQKVSSEQPFPVAR